MRKGARGGQSRIEKKGHSVGRQARTPDRVPQTHDGFLRSLTVDNSMAAAELMHQCEEGSVNDRVFVSLLERGYGKRQQKEDETLHGRRLRFIASDGLSWDKRLSDTTATTPEISRIRSFTLGNSLVRSRLLYEWEEGIMRPAIYKWFLERGPELLMKQTEQRPPLAIISEGGLPWLNDPMAEQEAEAIAAQEAQDKREKSVRQPPKQESIGLVAGAQEAEEADELEVYREGEDFR